MASRFMGTNRIKINRSGISKRIGESANGRIVRAVTYFCRDTAGDAVVEATMLFPIMIMIFAALVLLAIFLPAQAALQRATQYAATAIATENSDTWLFYDESNMRYVWETDKRQLKNVYAELFAGSGDIQSKGETIVIELESRSISSRMGQLSVNSFIDNKIIYKEVVVTATREIPMPVDLSFIRFPKAIAVTATSTAVVNNAEEFIRSIDMASDFADFIIEKFGLSDLKDTISSFGEKISGLLGW